jgi:hypothetical protein
MHDLQNVSQCLASTAQLSTTKMYRLFWCIMLSYRVPEWQPLHTVCGTCAALMCQACQAATVALCRRAASAFVAVLPVRGLWRVTTQPVLATSSKIFFLWLLAASFKLFMFSWTVGRLAAGYQGGMGMVLWWSAGSMPFMLWLDWLHDDDDGTGVDLRIIRRGQCHQQVRGGWKVHLCIRLSRTRCILNTVARRPCLRLGYQLHK